MKASPTLTNNLQAVLADLIELHIQGKQAHWNIVGPNFRDLHLNLDEVVAIARETGALVHVLHVAGRRLVAGQRVVDDGARYVDTARRCGLRGAQWTIDDGQRRLGEILL